ncbi:TPA: stage II sporulation protein M [Candidatus Woesearchaeota archaeon]|nr:stage II sporulation protein M [Candidatus Woesearchaeota archaeon]HII88526.1 stage II sporulation protein M [Candidatus Woesearchaeota archaeon]
MVLEEIKTNWIIRHPSLALALGFIYSLLGYILANMFFIDKQVSIAMLFITTLLVVPTMIIALGDQMKHEATQHENFFQSHRSIFLGYIYMFVGAFMGYMVLGIFADQYILKIFEYQLDFLKKQEGLSLQVLNQFFENRPAPQLESVLSILQHNLSVVLVCFIISLFVGAGGVFLVLLNASVFSSFAIVMVKYLTETLQQAALVIGIFSLHVIPEAGAFMVAAIAGGILSKAVIAEKWGTANFNKVVKDAGKLLAFSCVLIILAGFIEVYITTNLFYYFFPIL